MLSECNLPVIEVTSFISHKWVPQMADAELIAEGFKREPGIEYQCVYLNSKGIERAQATGKFDVEGVLSVIASEKFSIKNTNRTIEENLKKRENQNGRLVRRRHKNAFKQYLLIHKCFTIGGNLLKRLENKVALITGAGSGLGKAEALLFAEHGANVIITDINSETLYATENKMNDLGYEALAMKHDVSSEEEWQQVMKAIDKKFGEVDILINNAGIINRQGLEVITLEDFNFMHTINTQGTFLGMKSVTPIMKKSGGGSIINISSIFGLVGSEGAFAYHATKGAVKLMSKAAAIDLSKSFIRVNSIHPGVIETPMSNSIATKEGHPMKNKIPWPEIGKPEDVAYGALYLASDESKYVTGSELVIDGGYTAQ